MVRLQKEQGSVVDRKQIFSQFSHRSDAGSQGHSQPAQCQFSAPQQSLATLPPSPGG